MPKADGKQCWVGDGALWTHPPLTCVTFSSRAWPCRRWTPVNWTSGSLTGGRRRRTAGRRSRSWCSCSDSCRSCSGRSGRTAASCDAERAARSCSAVPPTSRPVRPCSADTRTKKRTGVL